LSYYPIPVASDTGALSDLPRNALANLGSQTAPVRLGIGAVVGAVLGHLAGKRAKLGALIGAGLAYTVKTTNADGSPVK
jgi:hypothetical protein